MRSGWRAAIFLLAFLIVATVLGFVANVALTAVHLAPAPQSGAFLVINGVLSLIPAILIGWGCGKLFEKLPFRALGAAFTRGWFRHFVLGSVIGAATLGFAVMIAFIFGGLRFELDTAAGSSGLLSSLGISLVVFAAAAAFEESLFRGYILQTFARSDLAWLAILLTSVFFGAVHIGNPNAGVISTANTVLAGLWFSVAYLKTRDLWFVWGLHLMWNWMQGSIFGIEVSGMTDITTAPLLREIDAGPLWLTGQTYGIEGGVACTIALMLSTAVIHFLPTLRPDKELLAMTTKSEPLTVAGG